MKILHRVEGDTNCEQCAATRPSESNSLLCNKNSSVWKLKSFVYSYTWKQWKCHSRRNATLKHATRSCLKLPRLILNITISISRLCDQIPGFWRSRISNKTRHEFDFETSHNFMQYSIISSRWMTVERYLIQPF